MSRAKSEATTTTYAVLGLLCLRPWSAYELTQQMDRSLRFVWPRAQSGIYREPPKLVAMGYARVKEVAAGPRRTKLEYSVTPAGRAAFRRWLKTPSAPPQFESEAMVKFLFSDQGTLDDAQRVLDELLVQGQALTDSIRAITASYAAGNGALPERLHIIAIRGRFLHGFANLLTEWASWARHQVNRWPDTGPAASHLGEQVIQENAHL